MIIGKGVGKGSKYSLPDFSFPQITEVFKENDFDPRNEKGQIPVNLEEAKNNLRQIFYSGLAEALKNQQLRIIAETLRQIEKVLDLTSKVIGLPFTVYRLLFVPAILPTLKDYLEKLFSTINRAATSGRVNSAATFSLFTFHFSLFTFSFSLLSLSKIILRL